MTVRVGLIARAEPTGLSTLTWEFARHLRPAKVLLADMTWRRRQHPFRPDWYRDLGLEVTVWQPNYPNLRPVKGYREATVDAWLTDLDVVFTAETAYDQHVIAEARRRGIRTVVQPMYEFHHWKDDPTLEPPDVFAAPSLWHIGDYPACAPTVHLPVPVARDRLPYRRRTEANVFYHSAGGSTARDRNGTQIVLRAWRMLNRRDLRLIVTRHGGVRQRPGANVEVRHGASVHYWDTFPAEADVMVMPRRYGGLCLPFNEASALGVPTVMPACPPNDLLLPPELLLPAKLSPPPIRGWDPGPVDVHDVAPQTVAEKVEQLAGDPTLVARLSDHADRYADWLSWGRLAPVYDRFLADVAAGRTPTGVEPFQP